MGRLHRTLAGQPARGELALNDLLTAVLSDFSAIFGDRLRSDVSISPSCRLDAARASIFMLAFSEIVANAMKYAHPTGLPVELTILGKSTPDGDVDLMIADDGVGLPEGAKDSPPEGKGLVLIRKLVESLAGRVEINSTELGLMFSIVLPAAEREETR